MLKLDTLNQVEIRHVVNANSLHKAQRYLNKIYDPKRIGETLTAHVRGSLMYQVEIHVEPVDPI